ncbi:MAG: hypothetical protein GXP38_08425 [Chloroflexi bacterium]|nr:hypothetical protein [Chloroflexota bacterium]
MSASILRKIMRKSYRTLRDWLQEPPLPPKTGQDRFAYGQINALVENIAAKLGTEQRPHYTWGMAHGAYLAQQLGIPRISVIELGVAGGNGLVALDHAAAFVENALGVKIDVFGFDSGSGLPKPQDYRDLPNLWSPGDFPMDEAALRQRLQRAQLFIGLVEKTIPAFLQARPAPIAFISFDLDLYSSTVAALPLLEADPALLLPRVQCYLDDILGFTFADFNGERLAVTEFNATHPHRKISPIYGARFYVPPAYSNAIWVEKLYMAHILDHPRYGDYDGLVRRPRMDLETT